MPGSLAHLAVTATSTSTTTTQDSVSLLASLLVPGSVSTPVCGGLCVTQGSPCSPSCSKHCGPWTSLKCMNFCPHLFFGPLLPYSSRDKQLLRPWVGVKVHRILSYQTGRMWVTFGLACRTIMRQWYVGIHISQGSYRVAGPPAAIWWSRQAWKRPRLPGICMWGMHSHHPLSLGGRQYVYKPNLLAIAACCPQRGLQLA